MPDEQTGVKKSGAPIDALHDAVKLIEICNYTM